MAVSLLKTKLYVPPGPPELISRPRLIERLNEGLRAGCRLALVSAQAGSGKTTLLAEWVRQVAPPTRAAWVSLDEGDNEPTRFWAYVAAALQGVRVDLGDAAQSTLGSPRSPTIEPLLTGLVNTLAEETDGVVLVLDDYHLIEAQSIHDAVAFLLQHLPPQAHVVLATRADPPLPLSRLRGRRQMIEVRQDDLRFTPGEAAAFLNGATGLGLVPEDIAALEARTEGWVVGLQMVALSVRGQSPQRARSLIRSLAGSHRHILDYLTDEVLLRQPDDVKSFLLCTSVLERLTGPLCDAVTGQENGQEMLELLAAGNLFVVPLDDERRWYRYHHLFASLLRHRQSTVQPDLLPVLHARASGWYERNGLTTEAIRHALATGDTERVTHLVSGSALTLLEHGELATLERWLASVPDDPARPQPWLLVARGWILAHAGRLDDVDRVLSQAEELACARNEATDGQGRRQLRGHLACIRSYVAGVRGDSAVAIQYVSEARDLLPADDLLTRAWAAMALGVHLLEQSDLGAAAVALQEAVATARGTGDSHVAALALCNLAVAQRQQGWLRRAAATFREALELAEERFQRAGQRLPVAGYAHSYLAGILREWNDLESAVRHAEEGVRISEAWGEPQLLVGSHTHLATIRQAVGDIDGALQAIWRARQAAAALSPWYASRVAPWEAQFRLEQGDATAARQWADAQHRAPTQPSDAPESWHVRYAVARVDLACGALEAALRSAERLAEEARSAGAGERLVASLVLQASVLRERGDYERALRALEEALLLAQPEGYVRTFTDEGAAMGDLLRRARSRGIATGYVDSLLAALGESGQRPAERGQSYGLAEPLSEREMDVLRLLARGLTGQEIADALYLSINTVKTHTKSIYGKLAVHSRVQAVRRAEELGLL